MKQQSLDSYKRQLKQNAETIAEGLNNYPRLSALLMAYNGSLYRKLMLIHEYLYRYGEDDARQQWSFHRVRGWEGMISLDTLVSLGGSDKETWRKAIFKLCALQMLGCFRPKTDKKYGLLNTSVQQLSADRAEAAGRNAVIWYRVPAYTDRLLQIADEKAEAVQQMGSGINKDAIRDAWGAVMANRVTDTGYPIHDDTQRRRQALKQALQRQLSAWGFTDSRRVMQEATEDTQSLDSFRWVETWKAYKRALYADLGLKEGRPTKAEKERWALKGDSWIIRQK